VQFDTAVIGLGAMGSASTWRLAARGASIIAFEQFEPANDRGSSHGESRIIRSAYYEGPQYVPFVQEAFNIWRQLEHESRVPLLTMTGALMVGPAECDLVAGTLLSARDHGLACELLDTCKMRARYPQLRLMPHEAAVYEQQAGILRPEDAVRAMVERAEALGAVVKRNIAVEALEVSSNTVQILTKDNVYHARHAIVASRVLYLL